MDYYERCSQSMQHTCPERATDCAIKTRKRHERHEKGSKDMKRGRESLILKQFVFLTKRVPTPFVARMTYPHA